MKTMSRYYYCSGLFWDADGVSDDLEMPASQSQE